MKPRASPPQNRSPCPRASARSVLTGRRARTGRAAEDVGPYHRSAPTRDVPVRRMARRAMSPTPGRQEAWGCRACKTLLADEMADEAARKLASKPSPCPRVSARSVLTGRRARTGRAAEDVGPYHRSAPTRDVPVRRMARRAMSPRRAVRRRGDVVRVKPSWRTRWRMKPRASQPQSHSPCPRASVLTGRRARTRQARPSRSGNAARRAMYPRRPRRVASRAQASLKTALRVPVSPRALC
mgnify:CR=1 FL=1